MIAPQRLLRLPSVICEACSQLGRSFRATERVEVLRFCGCTRPWEQRSSCGWSSQKAKSLVAALRAGTSRLVRADPRCGKHRGP